MGQPITHSQKRIDELEGAIQRFLDASPAPDTHAEQVERLAAELGLAEVMGEFECKHRVRRRIMKRRRGRD
jgi:ferric-dicitrate binding protein FerR (iron transport regulator)